MTDHTKGPDNPHEYGPLVLWLIAGSLFAVAGQVRGVANKIEVQNSLYLCVELWKLEGASDHCDAMLAARDAS